MRALVLANGPLGEGAPARLAARLAAQEFGLVVAADGGARHGETLGVSIDVVVGDLDSISPGLLEELERGGVEVLRFPSRKDEIDLELALQEARARGAKQALVVGALGARWDQTLANVMLSLSPELEGLEVILLEGLQSVRTLRGPGTLRVDAATGSTLSLIPLEGAAHGIRTRGLEYPLDGESVPFSTPRGVSNVVTSSCSCTSTTAILSRMLAAIMK